MPALFRALLILAFAAGLSHAFMGRASMRHLSTRPRVSILGAPTRVSVVEEEAEEGEEREEEEEEYVCSLSLQHVTTLRKEAEVRRKQNRLATFFVGDVEGVQAPFEESTVAAVRALLAESELVEVRGIAKHDIKLVTSAVHRLLVQIRDAEDAESESAGGPVNEDVDVIDDGLSSTQLLRRRGFAALLFRRRDDGQGVRLFTTRRKERPWARKVKPVRDSRGQIIPGEYA
jgi:hypothetical protein